MLCFGLKTKTFEFNALDKESVKNLFQHNKCYGFVAFKSS